MNDFIVHGEDENVMEEFVAQAFQAGRVLAMDMTFFAGGRGVRL